MSSSGETTLLQYNDKCGYNVDVPDGTVFLTPPPSAQKMVFLPSDPQSVEKQSPHIKEPAREKMKEDTVAGMEVNVGSAKKQSNENPKLKRPHSVIDSGINQAMRLLQAMKITCEMKKTKKSGENPISSSLHDVQLQQHNSQQLPPTYTANLYRRKLTGKKRTSSSFHDVQQGQCNSQQLPPTYTANLYRRKQTGKKQTSSSFHDVQQGQHNSQQLLPTYTANLYRRKQTGKKQTSSAFHDVQQRQHNSQQLLPTYKANLYRRKQTGKKRTTVRNILRNYYNNCNLFYNKHNVYNKHDKISLLVGEGDKKVNFKSPSGSKVENKHVTSNCDGLSWNNKNIMVNTYSNHQTNFQRSTKSTELLNLSSTNNIYKGHNNSSNNNNSIQWNTKIELSVSKGAPEKKKKKKKRSNFVVPAEIVSGFALKKNSVCVLNELRQGLQYKTDSMVGPMHSPTFVVSVVVDGQQFSGTGRNKKLAKQAAAEAALSTFIQFQNNIGINTNTPCPIDVDFASDTIETDVEFFSSQSNEFGKSVVRQLNGGKEIKSSALAVEKSPVMVLNDLKPGLKYECSSTNGDIFNKFTMFVTIDGKMFEGSGPSKKLAKAAAARSALSSIYDLSFGTNTVVPNNDYQYTPRLSPRVPCNLVPSHKVDEIARSISNKYIELMENDVTHMRRKVLAGIIMTTGSDCPGTVISLGTGTKCVSGEYISISGAVINDSHAEIIARRGLCYYLYNQLYLLTSPESMSTSVFEPRPEGNGYRLKDNIKFHLFINTSPCGDARIFSPHEANQDEALDKHPNRISRGQLRTKIESGEGTIPVSSSDGIQTWDGVLQGQRLLTMSCSDKVARWNVVGVQGALLSHFIEPIYFESVTLGSLFHVSHMYRAICGRIEMTVQGLPPPFRLNKPGLGVTSSAEARHTGKAPNHSVNWIIGEQNVEVINAVTGKKEIGGSSRLCKQNMFKLFSRLVGRLTSVTGLTKDNCPNEYASAKLAAADYNVAKKQLIDAFGKAKLGMWLNKPIEQNCFVLDTSEFQ